MCPSYKVTRNRVHSPKGRASLIREWIKQLGEYDFDVTQFTGKYVNFPKAKSFFHRRKNSKKAVQQYDFSHEVMDSMSQCLACKSCVGQCPIKVDVPEFRSKFLALYHTRYAHPLKDYFVANLERIAPLAGPFAATVNTIQSLTPVKQFLKNTVGFVDSPKFSRVRFNKQLKKWGVRYANADVLNHLSVEEKADSVIIVQDAFTRYFDAQVVLDSIALLIKIGFKPLIAPFSANGKPLHVHGFLTEFKQQAEKTASQLNTLARSDIPLVGIDPAMTLAYRAEYVKALGEEAAPNVQLIQEWLMEHRDKLENKKALFKEGTFKLLGHCTEKTNAPASTGQWQKIFSALGQTLAVESVGCCGMAGTYGHETKNREASASIFNLSWRKPIEDQNNAGKLIATGYSCRSQSLREAGVPLSHPLQALLKNAVDSK